jgi:hypothetical protein
MTIQDYQQNIKLWTTACFGEATATNVLERNYRFLEESLELVQAGGITKDQVLLMVDYVFGRPKGEVNQEVGGTLVTLAAFCNARGINLQKAAVDEMERFAANMDKIREKHKTKTLKAI